MIPHQTGVIDPEADTDAAPTLRDSEPATLRAPETLRCPPTERASWGRMTTEENLLPPSGRRKRFD